MVQVQKQWWHKKFSIIMVNVKQIMVTMIKQWWYHVSKKDNIMVHVKKKHGNTMVHVKIHCTIMALI